MNLAPTDRWLTDREQEVWRRLLAVESHLRDRLDRDLRSAHGLSLADYAVLVQLSEAPGREMRMSELAERLLLSRSGLTRRVDALVRSGLVCRRVCRVDKRGANARLTDDGLDRLERAAPTHVAGVRRYLIGPLGDLDGLCRGLALLEASLSSPASEGCTGEV